jgi:hypothetical protein
MAIDKKTQDEAIRIVEAERVMWEDPTVWVTDRVEFRMKEIIRACRKAYYGVFDEPFDAQANRDKTWIPLVQNLVEDVWKSSNPDMKDMMFRAKNEGGIEITELVRAKVYDYLRKNYYGQILDESTRQLLIDGTLVWKTWKDGKNMRRRTVDVLNIYIDPTEDNIQEAYRVTERSLMLPMQIERQDWTDSDDITGQENLDRYLKTAKYQDVWEMWGKIPGWMVGIKGDEGEDEIDGHIIVSGLESKQKRVHLVEQNTNEDSMGNIIKPYEECQLTKTPGRWYGIGIAERTLALQEWLNTIDNIRINRNYVAQLGLFKIRRGAGVTPQMLSKLTSNGAIEVGNMEDIQQFQVQEPGQTAYEDEQVIRDWATRIASAYPISTGESVPASQTATTSAIQNTNAKTAFVNIRNTIGFFLERWMDRHALPIILSNVGKGDFVRYLTDDEAFGRLADRISTYYVSQEYYKLPPDQRPSTDELKKALENAENELRARPELLVKLTKKLLAENVDTEFYTSNEPVDTTVRVQNLISMLQFVPNYQESIVRQAFDLMGLPFPKQNAQQQMPPMAAGTPGMSSNATTPNGTMQGYRADMTSQQQAVTNANTQTN